MNIRRIFIGAISLAYLVFLSGCYGAALERLWLKSPGWSRGQLISRQTIAAPAPVAVDQGGGIYLLWVNEVAEKPIISVRALDEDGVFRWERKVELPAGRVDDPEMVWFDNALHLFWLLDKQLFSARLNPDGEQSAPPKLLSSDVDIAIDSYAIAENNDRKLAVWFAGNRRNPGLYAWQNEGTVLVDPTGTRPDVIYDSSGGLHASWAFYPVGRGTTQIFYAAYSNGAHQVDVEPFVLAAPRLGGGSLLAGPWLGLDVNTATVLWNITVRTGLDAGRSATDYVAFPITSPPTNLALTHFRLPTTASLPYQEAANSPLIAGERVPVGLVPANSEPGPTQISVNRLLAGEMAIATRVESIFDLRKRVNQINVAFFQNGEPTATQLLTFTPGESARPYLINDHRNYLYLTWNEPTAAGFDIYFATTNPDLVGKWNRTFLNDVPWMLFETGFGMLTGFVLSPILGFLWLIVPLLLYAILSFFIKGEEKERGLPASTWAILTVVALIYTLQKFITLPGIADYVPFSAWLPIANWMKVPLQILIPILVTLVSVRLSKRYTLRPGSQSPLYFLLLFIGIDTALTAAFYGTLFYNLR